MGCLFLATIHKWLKMAPGGKQRPLACPEKPVDLKTDLFLISCHSSAVFFLAGQHCCLEFCVRKGPSGPPPIDWHFLPDWPWLLGEKKILWGSLQGPLRFEISLTCRHCFLVVCKNWVGGWSWWRNGGFGGEDGIFEGEGLYRPIFSASAQNSRTKKLKESLKTQQFS